MARRHFNLLDRASFTASIGDTPIAVSGGVYVERFHLGISGLVSVATVGLAAFLADINPIQIKINGNPVYSMRAQDILAFNSLFLGRTPEIFLGAVAANDKVDGLQMPFWYTLGANDTLSYLITRAGVTNISAEVVTLSYATEEGKQRPGRYDLVEVSGSTPAATGPFIAIPLLPTKGRLVGLLLFSNTPVSSTVDTPTIRRLNVYRNNVLDLRFMWHDLAGDEIAMDNFAAGNALDVMLTNYRLIDLRDDPWDLTTTQVRIDIDSGVASDAFRIIPIFYVAGAGPAPAPAPPR